MKTKKILLISPPSLGLKDKISYPPLGLMYLASNLQGKHRLEILNMISGKEKIRNDCDIYGVSIPSISTFFDAQKVIKRIRKFSPKALIVTGGAFPTSMAKYTLTNTQVDIVVKGEGELTFNEIVNNINELENINGISFRKNGKIINTPPRELIKNLDEIKFPSRYLLPKDQIAYEGKVHHTDQAATTILLTRGCPWNCNYCQKDMWTRSWRYRSVENIKKEIKEIIDNYGVKWFRIPDDNLTVNKSWFLKLCGVFNDLGVKWTLLSRPDTIDLEMLKKAKESGCQEAFFGFESGSQRMLKLMGRKNTLAQSKKAIDLCKEAGLKICAYMIFGFPGENEDSIDETIRFLKETKPDKARLSTFIPIPGTDVWNNPEKYNIRIKENFSDFWYFDNPDTGELYPFGLEYDYLDGGNEEMNRLRKKMISFFIKEGYIRDWTKT